MCRAATATFQKAASPISKCNLEFLVFVPFSSSWSHSTNTLSQACTLLQEHSLTIVCPHTRTQETCSHTSMHPHGLHTHTLVRAMGCLWSWPFPRPHPQLPSSPFRNFKLDFSLLPTGPTWSSDTHTEINTHLLVMHRSVFRSKATAFGNLSMRNSSRWLHPESVGTCIPVENLGEK